ncbi:exodeoxyribonuclease V subunit beta [Carnimonas nigrificans]|uniref:exodeoxyribonuclease V subunit beta n=1 Tax=Carnimonas nigrificans TaxID=64323 RepID=UPI00046FE2FA|nr:exodeoxyribonuclease V subunit beta [Carnimonas nigrificans]
MTEQRLDIATLPLTGRRLIEASAGTGKTFTIAALYVRLVLGHGELVSLTPEQILVVTFTRAATEELRERIRRRLREARDMLLGRAEGDAILAGLLCDYDEEQRRLKALQLDSAVRMMDDAAIFTIHGFCQRMLKRHAFDSGARFNVELTSNGDALLQQAVEDYWRRHYYPLDVEAQRLIFEQFECPAALAERVRIALNADVEGRLLEGDTLLEVPASAEGALAATREVLAQLEKLTQRVRDNFGGAAIEALNESAHSKAFNATRIKPDALQERIALLEQWCAGGATTLPTTLLDSKGSAWLGQQRLDASVKKGFQAPQHALFEALDALAEAQQRVPDPAPALISHALQVISDDISATKRRAGTLDFGDLLSELDNALQGAQGARLAASIRHELPIALIDEFQDTDARQYRIFNIIYARSDDTPATGLLLIGDPKQAIYAFRNADLATYLNARDSADAGYTLDRNFRSTNGMVSAVNALFAHNPNAFMEKKLHFAPSAAQGRAQQLMVAGQPEPALSWWLPESSESMSKSDYQRVMSTAVRADIQRLLEGGAAGQIGFGNEEGVEQPLQAHHIAVLVRTGREAQLVRDALEAGNIKSVYLSQRQSVFESHEAWWLLQLLEAVGQPRRESSLRAALASRLLSDDLSEVEQLVADERRWEAMVERFEGYQRDWRYIGVLAMVRRVMLDFAVGARLLASASGERSLTNLLHLAELAQTASHLLDGEQALLRWLHRALDGRFEEGMDPDSLTQRLESDEQLVRVVTIHGSKGLEYPVVYVPFPCDYREQDRRSPAQLVQHPRYGRAISLAVNEEQREWAEEARHAEDVRLLYVALTRASYACRVGVAPLYKGRKRKEDAADATTIGKSALGWLLKSGPEDALSGTRLREVLKQLAAYSDMCILPPPEAPGTPLADQLAAPPERRARPFEGHIDRRWWIASYSVLTSDTQTLGADPPSAEEAALDLEVATERTPVPAPPLGKINDFPRGPRAGTFLHGILGAIDFNRIGEFDYSHELEAMIERRLARSGFDDGWQTPLCEWLKNLLDAPLMEEDAPTNSALRLAALGEQQAAGSPASWAIELEFWLPVANASAQAVDHLIRHHQPLARSSDYPALAPRQLHGMLRGFIDLVFSWQGHWYLLDWKSNYLGERGEEYAQAQLAAAMLDHRYDVQYVLYVLALHRHLAQRLPDYSYQRDMGGVFYLFLRGVDTARPGQGIFHARPPLELIEALDNMLQGEAVTLPQQEAQ